MEWTSKKEKETYSGVRKITSMLFAFLEVLGIVLDCSQC